MFWVDPTPPPTAAERAGVLVDNVGGQLVDVAAHLAPVAVPFLLALGAIAFVMNKFSLREGKGGIFGSLETDPVELRAAGWKRLPRNFDVEKYDEVIYASDGAPYAPRNPRRGVDL